MTPQRVTLITLGVADLARARRYYAALGWAEHARSMPEIAFFQMPGAVLGLFALEDLAGDQQRRASELGTGAITLAINYDTEIEVDAAFERALAAGGRAIKHPQLVVWGGYSGYVADPDGHVWEYAVNPFWPLAPDGTLTLPDPD